jgi:hypothetical protein
MCTETDRRATPDRREAEVGRDDRDALGFAPGSGGDGGDDDDPWLREWRGRPIDGDVAGRLLDSLAAREPA